MSTAIKCASLTWQSTQLLASFSFFFDKVGAKFKENQRKTATYAMQQSLRSVQKGIHDSIKAIH